MTMITYQDGARSRSPSSTPVYSWFVLPIEKAKAAWTRRQTERMLEGLPHEIRKDIGWPTPVTK